MDRIKGCTGFQWGDGNSAKIPDRHGMSPAECEQLFFNIPLIVADDEKHSVNEARFYALGQADSGRLLFVVFTIRENLIRVIFRARYEPKRKENLPCVMKKIPKFKSEIEERKFWSSHDSVDYIDWRSGQRAVLSDLRPSVRAISIRLPQAMLDD